MLRARSRYQNDRGYTILRRGSAITLGLGAAVAAWLLFCGLANAAAQPSRWTPPNPEQDNNHFVGCSARFKNADGLSLIYSLSRSLVWSLELSNDAWKFVNGASFNVLLRIGDLYLSQPAVAISDRTVRVQLRDSLHTFRVLSRVWEFDLMAGAVSSHFSLAFGDRVLTDLVRCVEKRDVSLREKRDIDLNLAAPPLHDTEQAFDKDAERLNSEILREAGTAGTSIGELMPITVRLRPNSVSRVGANLLMTSVVPARGFANVGSLIHIVMARDMKACRGDLFAGVSFERLRQKAAARGYMNCRTPQSGISVHYVVTARPAGGYFLIATLFIGPELVDATEQAAAALDQHVWAVVSAMSLGEKGVSRP